MLVGDTPRDIRAAREAGARAVAVASGPHGAEELGEAEAVLPDLRDAAAVLHRGAERTLPELERLLDLELR